MTTTVEAEDKKPWLYAFLILALVSAWMIVMRLLNTPFLQPEFEIALIYLPTVLAGVIVTYLTIQSRRISVQA
jgi:TRAP-type C4-dicarboxylate transport system permease small subunit